MEIPTGVLEALRQAAPEKRITCARAHQLAAELKVSLIVIGAACDSLGIKIGECQLGCF